MKKFILALLAILLLAAYQAYADTGSKVMSAGQNTVGLSVPIDCSAPGSKILSITINSPSSSTVNIQTSGDKSFWINFSTTPIINGTSGIAYFNIATSIPFWQVSSATTGVPFSMNWGCK